MLISIPELPESLCYFPFVGSISISKQLASIKGKAWGDGDVHIASLPGEHCQELKIMGSDIRKLIDKS